MKGGVPLTRGQEAKLLELGYTTRVDDTGRIIIEGQPSQLLINTRLARDVRKDSRFRDFGAYIQGLLDSDLDIPDNITDMACKYISGCDLEINQIAKAIMENLLTNPQVNAEEIQEFQSRTKKIGSFQNTSDGLKDLRNVQEVIFNELPRPPPDSKGKRKEQPQLQPSTLYKYVIIRESDGTYKIYYSCAQGLYHFSYIDYYIKKNYNEDGTRRAVSATNLFFVKNTSIPEKILFSMSWGNPRVKHEWFSLLKDYALQQNAQNAQNINDFVIANINRYQNVLNAFDGDLAAIIEKMGQVENINDYRDYVDDWNTIVMGSEISHSCLTYALEVVAAGEFCTDENGNIYYVDGWSGHFKTPQQYIHVIQQAFHQYGYNFLQNFVDHLARNQGDVKCPDEAAENCNSQLTRSVTSKKQFIEFI
jgi:hypothetical protein